MGFYLMTTGMMNKPPASFLAVHLQVGQRWWQGSCRRLLVCTALKQWVILGLGRGLPAWQTGDLTGRIWMYEVSKC